jgi:hypothetical protein
MINFYVFETQSFFIKKYKNIKQAKLVFASELIKRTL